MNPEHAQTPEPGPEKQTVSEETRAIVERRMADQPDEIKQKLGELVEAIKRRASTEMQSAGEITRENYVNVMDQARERLRKTETFFQEQERAVEKSVQEVTDTATERWEGFVTELQQFSNRLDKAVNAAWQVLTQPDRSEDESGPDS